MKILNNLKIKYKIIFIATFINLLIILFISISLKGIVKKETESMINRTDIRLRDAFDLYIRYQVETAYSMVDNLYKLAEKGDISKEQAKDLAIKLLRDIRYGLKSRYETDGYFWVDTVEGVNLVLYGREDVEGKNRDEWVDAYGNYMIRDMRDKALKGGGFTDYWFPKLGESTPSHKRSYSLYHKGLDFIIGTGSYTEDIEAILNIELKHREEIALEVRNKLGAIYIFGIILLVLGIYFLVDLLISKPIKLVSEHANKLANFQLDTKHFEFLDRDDEIGLLERSFKSINDNLSDVVFKIKNTTNKITISVQELEKGNEELATMSAEQAASLEETSATLEEINAIVTLHTDKAIKLGENMEYTEAKATMISEISDTLKEYMEEIKSSSNKVSLILEILDDLSFQTNILALNAAVEASRAGTQGKGFSVITNEIRNLSRKSTEASKEISNLIKESHLKIIGGEALIEVVIMDLEGILEQIKNTNDDAQEIASGADEHKKGIDLISIAISELNDITQTNAGIAEETSEVAENLNVEYLKLLELIKIFKVLKH